MKYIIPQQTILLFILLVGCEGVYTPKDDVHPLVGIWAGMEREYYSVHQGDTSSVIIDSTNSSWTFKEDFTFSGWNETSYDDISYTGSWNVIQNQLTLTLGIGEQSEISIYDYIINNNNLALTRKIYPLENDSEYFEITTLRMLKSN